MLFQLETKNVETGVVYKSPLYSSFADARDEARAVSMAGRRTVRVVQVNPASTAESERPFIESEAYDYQSWLEGA